MAHAERRSRPRPLVRTRRVPPAPNTRKMASAVSKRKVGQQRSPSFGDAGTSSAKEEGIAPSASIWRPKAATTSWAPKKAPPTSHLTSSSPFLPNHLESGCSASRSSDSYK
eukprot:COSAG01_NODE_22577_length_850_cov_0.904128_2_plen_111_part_00